MRTRYNQGAGLKYLHAAPTPLGWGSVLMIRGFLNRLALAVVVAAGLAGSVSVAFAQNVVVHGNRRVDTDTVRSYFT
ncbi:MAG: hypothetical protein QOD25_250, partial [Alphaproteobacteria bacterium]|nr:hypothetical protein [Alphaproteobacteria bacterium]